MLQLRLAANVESGELDPPEEDVEQDDGEGGIVDPVTVLPRYDDLVCRPYMGKSRMGPAMGKYGNPQSRGLWDYLVQQPYGEEMRALVEKDKANPFEGWQKDTLGKPDPPALFTDPANEAACGGTTKTSKAKIPIQQQVAPGPGAVSAQLAPELEGEEEESDSEVQDATQGRHMHRYRKEKPLLSVDKLDGRWTTIAIKLPTEAQRGGLLEEGKLHLLNHSESRQPLLPWHAVDADGYPLEWNDVNAIPKLQFDASAAVQFPIFMPSAGRGSHLRVRLDLSNALEGKPCPDHVHKAAPAALSHCSHTVPTRAL